MFYVFVFRREAEAVNQLDEELAAFLRQVLKENENLVVVRALVA